MTKRDFSDGELDALFEAQRADVPSVSEPFLSRIAEDAAAAAGKQTGPTVAKFARRGPLAALREWTSGLAAPGGLVAAGLLGVWIGVAAPQSVPDPALLWSAPDALSAVQLDDWYGVQDLENLEWDDG